MRERNEDGFTLVEIIVSIAIGVVVLGLVLSIILTSFDTFGTFSTKKLKKEALDSIVEYVRDEIQNSTDVVISKTPPKLSTSNSGNWKWLAVSGGRLYYGHYTYNKDTSKGTGSGRMYTNDSYYNTKDSYDRDASNTTLSIKYSKKTANATSETKTSTSKVRIVTLYYTLSYSSEQYKKNDAIEFSNVSEVDKTDLNNGDIHSLADVQAKDAISLDNTSTANLKSFTNSDTSITRLYYQKSNGISSGENNNNNNNNNNNDNPNLTHTVADKINEITANNNRGYYVGRADNFQDSNNENFYDNPESKNSFYIPLANTYRPGDFVYYKGNWWLLMQISSDPENNEPKNGGAGIWQCLDGEFHIGDTYNKGDVVKYNNIYYKYLGESSAEWNPPTSNETTDKKNTSGKLWLNLGTDVPTSVDGYDKTFSNLASGKGTNAITQETPSSSPALDSSRASLPNVTASTIKYDTSVPIYDPDDFNTTNYKVGDLIQVKVQNSGDTNGNNPYYRLYKKIFEPAAYIDKKNKVPGNSFQSGWELLENEYMPSSAYPSGATLRLGTSNLKDLDTTADYIRVKTLKDNISNFKYKDTNSGKEAEVTLDLSLNNVCSSETELYYGLKYDYIDKNSVEGHFVTYSYNDNQVKQFVLDKVTFNNSDVTSYKNSDFAITKAMIYLPKETSQSEVSNAKSNGTVRDQIWERISLNDAK